MSLRLFTICLVFLVSVSFLFSGQIATAGFLDNLNSTASQTLVGAFGAPQAGWQPRTVTQAVGIVIKAAMGLLSIVFVILFLYAGINWMTAGGNDERLAASIHTIQYAVIGLLISLAGYVLAYFVFNIILEAALGETML